VKTSLYIAKRYFFSKKSQQVINLTAMISVVGMLVSTAAMIIVLSGFNGIEQLVKDLYKDFNADLVIAPKHGKTFSIHSIDLEKITATEGVDKAFDVIEEITMLKKGDNYVFATMKGVGQPFFNTTLIENRIVEGTRQATDNEVLIGEGLQVRLRIYSTMGFDNNFTVYGLLRQKKLTVNQQNAFNPKGAQAVGIFRINPEFDNKFFIAPITFAEQLLRYEDHRSALEITVKSGYLDEQVKANLLTIIGDDFIIKTRYEQNELLFKTNETEKWMVFIILGFIMIIAAFNIIASLTMLIIDKSKDINTLTSFGATPLMIRQIFFFEGLFINFSGGIIGILIGLFISWLQQTFHFIKMENAIVEFWPVIIKGEDVLLVFATVLTIGVLSSWLPVRYLVKRHFQQSAK
jgi:lipoprotein-releasing system permease protein